MGQDVQCGDVQLGDDGRAGQPVVLVCMAGCGTGTRFDPDIQPESGLLPNGFRRAGNPPLTLPAFPRYAQFHPPAPLRT